MQAVRFIDPDKDRNQFFATLRGRVDEYFKKNQISKNGNSQMVIKTTVLFLGYLVPFMVTLIFPLKPWLLYSLWACMGFAMAGIGMSVMHDANHGAYSSNSRVNYWMGHTLNLLGGSVFNWKLQHNILHHTYTNIVNMDDDIDDKLVMRFSPHTRVKWYQRFQFVYAFFFYGILTLYWALLKDLVQFIQYTRRGVNKNSSADNRNTILKITLAKILYFGIFLVLPLTISPAATGQIILGFLLMHFIAGVVLTVIFQLAHTVEETSHPLPNDSDVIENSWAIHQLNTTVNFSRNNKWLSWYVGGLNFQVEHHLFPNICHVHYPEISHIVKATSEEYGIPYLENQTFLEALKSHISVLKKFGKMPHINEAIS